MYTVNNNIAVCLKKIEIWCASLIFRISELFTIIVEYPDSLPAIQDLKVIKSTWLYVKKKLGTAIEEQ